MLCAPSKDFALAEILVQFRIRIPRRFRGGRVNALEKGLFCRIRGWVFGPLMSNTPFPLRFWAV